MFIQNCNNTSNTYMTSIKILFQPPGCYGPKINISNQNKFVLDTFVFRSAE